MTVPLPRALMIEFRDLADRAEAIDATDPTESTDAAEPIEAIDATEPIEPIENSDPRQPMHSIESSDHNDHFEGMLLRSSAHDARRCAVSQLDYDGDQNDSVGARPPAASCTAFTASCTVRPYVPSR